MIEAVNGSAEWPKVITNLRIFSEGGDGWSIDGFNENTGEYTSQILTYDTFAEAVSKLLDFVKYLEEDGVRIEWRRPDRAQRHHHHWESWGSYGDMRCAVTNCTAVMFAHSGYVRARQVGGGQVITGDTKCLNCDSPLEEHVESPSTGIAWCPNGRTEFSPEEHEEEE